MKRRYPRRTLRRLGAGAGVGLALAVSFSGCRQIVGIEERAACDGADGLAPCASCVLTSCCSELLACRQDASCASLEGCLTTCDDDPGCRMGCRQPHSAGFNDRFAELEACRGSRCAEACGYAGCAGYVFATSGCADCAASSSCCDEVAECAIDAPCLALTYCQQHCEAGASGCRGDCERMHRDGIEKGLIAGACLEDHCNPQCYGREPPTIDESTSCVDAVVMQPDSPDARTPSSASGVISESEDMDFFTVTLDEGQWVRISTVANPENELSGDFCDSTTCKLDTVITVRRADSPLTLASADDSYPRGFGSTDSELLWRAPEAATYCLSVEDFTTWGFTADAPNGQPSFAYDLQVELMGPQDEWNLDTGDNDSFDDAQPATSRALTSADYNEMAAPFLEGARLSWIAGVLDATEDRDFFEVTAASDGMLALYLSPSGPGSRAASPMPPASGSGSTGGIGRIAAYDGTGALLAEIDYPTHTPDLGVQAARDAGFTGLPVTKGDTIVVAVEHDGREPGSNDFYAFKLFTLTQVRDEGNDAANQDPSGAELIPSNRSFRGTLAEGDVDTWRWEPPPDVPGLSLFCRSGSAGTGVRGLHVSYLDGSTKVPSLMQTGTEDPVDGVLWSSAAELTWATDGGVPFTSSGPHYIQLQNASEEADGPAVSRDYHCIVGSY